MSVDSEKSARTRAQRRGQPGNRGQFAESPLEQAEAVVIVDSERSETPEQVLAKFPGCRYVVREEEHGLDLWHRDGWRFRLTVEDGPQEVDLGMVASSCYALEVSGSGIESGHPRTVVCGPHSRRWSAQQVA